MHDGGQLDKFSLLGRVLELGNCQVARPDHRQTMPTIQSDQVNSGKFLQIFDTIYPQITEAQQPNNDFYFPFCE